LSRDFFALQRFRALDLICVFVRLFLVIYGNSGAISRLSLAIFMEIGTIFRQQDSPIHSFGGKIKIYGTLLLKPL